MTGKTCERFKPGDRHIVHFYLETAYGNMGLFDAIQKVVKTVDKAASGAEKTMRTAERAKGLGDRFGGGAGNVGKPMQNRSTPCQKPLGPEGRTGGLCSNDRYSTKYCKYLDEDNPLREFVCLDDESLDRLRSALGSEGDSALSGISDLCCLEAISLHKMGISDISAISGLANLRYLNLGGNSVSDLSPISKLANLERLFLVGNPVSDISALGGLQKLRFLALSDTLVLRDLSKLDVLKTLPSLEAVNAESLSPGDCRALRTKLGITVICNPR